MFSSTIIAESPGVIFLFPLAFSVVGTLVYLVGESGGVSKSIALVLLLTSLYLQFGSNVHFLAPLGIQLILFAWIAIYFQMDNCQYFE